MKPPHIAILTPGFAADEADTNCVPALQDFLLAFRREHPAVALTVFALRYPHTRQPYEWHGIPVKPADGRQRRFPFSLLSKARLMRSFVAETRRAPIDLVHSFWLGECAALGERFSRRYNIPHIVTLMGQEVVLPNRHAQLLQCKSTTFVAVSSFQRRELVKNTGRDVHHVIPWGLDALPVAHVGTRDIDVLGVGSLTEVKDFATFLDVVARVRVARPTLSCRIAGEGPLRPALEAKAKALGLEHTIRFEVQLPREQVFDLMRRSKVLLHTSTFESFGLVFAEALACGMRIVSRPVGIAEPGSTWAVCDDTNEMAAAIESALVADTPTTQLSYPIANTVSAYHDLYSRLLGAAKPVAETARQRAAP